jgi:proteic killer suppression protein
VLDAAMVIRQVDVPGFKLHKLSGDLTGLWAVTVNGNWRVIFSFKNGETELVDYLDYH